MNKHQTAPIIAVAMSGGVDSSVAAALLLEQGHSIFGVTMRLPQARELLDGAQHAPESEEPAYLRDAQRAADILGIRLLVVDVRQAFRERIIQYFCEEYVAGRTPNPCVVCNPLIKFGLLFDHSAAAGAERLATGHYVKAEYQAASGRYLLRAASDAAKDQSYFLYRLSQAQLARAIFPLGGMTKADIRERAKYFGLTHVAEKAESQENCFVANQSYQAFLQQFLSSRPKAGKILDTQGHEVGTHQGIHLFTIGQRKGLGVAFGSPRYVVEIRPDANAVVIGENHDLFASRFAVKQVNLIAVERLREPLRCRVKIRYRHAAAPATVLPTAQPDEVLVALDEAQRAVTPGQSAVFYNEDVLIGGGVIERTE